jgi:hypothetical protein
LSASRIPADNCTTGIRFKHVHDAANHAVVTDAALPRTSWGKSGSICRRR